MPECIELIKNSDIYKVTVIVDNHKIMLHGIVDTGNQLTDKYTGKPVNVMDKSYFENVSLSDK